MNKLWLGEVPKVLCALNYVERLLVAQIHHNHCFVKVASSGLKKMTAHVIAFESPLPKVYHILPPPVKDMDNVLAILSTGPLKPTEQDLAHLHLLAVLYPKPHIPSGSERILPNSDHSYQIPTKFLPFRPNSYQIPTKYQPY